MTTRRTQTTDRFATAKSVADAVLYEGYVLYPYRASSRKNQLRWQFGVLAPRAFTEIDSSERFTTRTECLMESEATPTLHVRVRCLQVQQRTIEARHGDQFVRQGRFEVAGTVYVDWEEAVEQVVDLEPLDVGLLRLLPTGRRREHVFEFAAGDEVEPIRSSDGAVVGQIVRRRQAICGRVLVTATAACSLTKITVAVENTTGWSGTSDRRDAVMGSSLVAVHTMLAVEAGRFVSLLDPPAEHIDAVAQCHSEGAFPVLIENDDLVLSSPIILYDHPEVAPESPGDLYDSTEIDEILALRVLTLTDDEKAEARGTDPRAAAVIDRCDDMQPETWDRLHGIMRRVGPVGAADKPDDLDVDDRDEVSDEPFSDAVKWWDPDVDAAVDPWSDSVTIAGVEVAKGTAVRLRPSRRSDAQDVFLKDMLATVAGVFKDVDGNEQVAVTVDDDPASEELSWQGRYLFFFPDEIEPLNAPPASREVMGSGGAAPER